MHHVKPTAIVILLLYPIAITFIEINSLINEHIAFISTPARKYLMRLHPEKELHQVHSTSDWMEIE